MWAQLFNLVIVVTFFPSQESSVAIEDEVKTRLTLKGPARLVPKRLNPELEPTSSFI